MVMHIKTNNRSRPLKCLNDIPEKDRPEFDYLKDPNEARLVRIGTDWYDARDTQGISIEPSRSGHMGWLVYVEATSPLAAWNAVTSESHWSGKLFRFVGSESVVTGTYHERDTPMYLCNKKRFETLEKAKVHASKIFQKTGVIVAIEEAP